MRSVLGSSSCCEEGDEENVAQFLEVEDSHVSVITLLLETSESETSLTLHEIQNGPMNICLILNQKV